MKVIDLLNKIANGELEENTRFYDNYEHKTYIYKPTSYNGIYPEGTAYAHENWYLTLKGSSRLLDEVEIIEEAPKEDKKIEKLDYCEENTLSNLKEPTYLSVKERQLIDSTFKTIKEKFDEIIEVINGRNI